MTSVQVPSTAVFAHRRIRALIALAIIVPLGMLLKFVYAGPGAWWVNNWGSSFAYEIMFMLLAFIVWPRRRAITPIAIAVCVMTCVLEFGQMWKPAWLQAIRGTFFGAALLGTSFTALDLPAYPIGCLLGWFLLRFIVSATPHEGT